MRPRFLGRRRILEFSGNLADFCLFAILLSTGITLSYTAPTEAPYVPVFIKNPNQTERTLPVPFSSSTKLDCSVHAHPKPAIKWYKVNQSTGIYKLLKNRVRPFIRSLKYLVKSAKFMCNVSNALGYRTRVFRIRVFEYIMSKPLVQDLANATATEGQTVRLSCIAAGDALPHFVFYKWTNKSSFERVDRLKEMHGRINVETSSAPRKTEFFKHYLTIYNTTSADAGRYTCVVGNSKGVVKKDTFLSIILVPPSSAAIRPTSSVAINGWLVGAVIVAVVVFALLVMALIYRRHLRRKLTMKEEEMRVIFEQEGKSLPRSPVRRSLPLNSVPSSGDSFTGDVVLRGKFGSYGDGFSHVTLPLDKKWEIDREHLKIEGELGEGAFGLVLKAVAVGVQGLPAKHTVAIKTLKENATEVELVDLLSEMNTMKNIGKHKNIVNLIGCCTQNGPLYIVIEYANFGNLRQFLRKRRPTKSDYVDTSTEESSLTAEKEKEESDITMVDLVSFAFQIARGMEYLESKKCVHRDLAGRNILVSEGRVLKIADFGLARDIHAMDYYRKTTDGRLPVKWMAIEALFDRVYSSKSDVWGFGVVLWEIMTFGGTPYPSLPVADLFKLLKSGYRMEKPLNCPQNIYETMLSCWVENPVNRPSFTNLVNQFDAVLTGLVSTDYLDTASSDHVRLSPSASNVLSETTSLDDTVFHENATVSHEKQTNIIEDDTKDRNSNTKSCQNSEDIGKDHETTKIAIKPASSYELLSGTPELVQESDV